MSGRRPELSENVLKELRSRGIAPETVISQIEMFERGIPPVELVRPCVLGDGIESLEDGAERYARLFDRSSGEKKIVKFVPASGAASRMFKELLAVLGRAENTDRDALRRAAREGDGEAAKVLGFMDSLRRFAFLEDLCSSLEKAGHDPDDLLSEGGSGIEILEHALLEKGLNYASLPKGMILFHRYPEGSRTAFEEHLVEALDYARGIGGRARVHFTLSPEHVDTVRAHIGEVRSGYGNGGTLEIEYSVQKPSTDTIAVGMDNKPLLDSEGRPVFRPGGHGALIENLNDLDCDIAFIKNIDNVVPDRLKGEISLYKKALGGYLIELERGVFSTLRMLDEGAPEDEMLKGLGRIADMGLEIPLPGRLREGEAPEEKARFIRGKLMRPLRVCGVVKNLGEPGGGPFFVRESDGSVSKQIVEAAQVDMSSPAQRKIWESSTHFNPVDIVCGLRDYKGRRYDLREYMDPEAAFISVKSSDGKEIKALELPGLWNGAMARWNTVFVEVPLATFNPVKTVLDLLRPEHQPG